MKLAAGNLIPGHAGSLREVADLSRHIMDADTPSSKVPRGLLDFALNQGRGLHLPQSAP